MQPKIVKVFPTKASALNLSHPVSGKMKENGANWVHDSFTYRRLEDGSVTLDASKLYKKDAPKAAPKFEIKGDK